MSELTGRIFNIQKCSIRDGRGMRTTVFFKGCGLRCLWCANPEGISFAPEISLNPVNCMGCGFCLKKCPAGAIRLDDKGAMQYDRSKCNACGLCAQLCPTEARKQFGTEYTVEGLFRRIYQDRFYFEHSKGGVTFSGGEALMQPEFLLAVCKKCREYKIHVAIETCGCGNYERFAPCLDYIDFIYFDIKHMDEKMHQKITGQSNVHILENLKRISEHGNEICVRTPVVPGWNDSDENIRATAEFITLHGSIRRYELLAYHKLGINKYKILDRQYQLDDVEEPDIVHMRHLVDTANEILLPVGKKCFYNSENSADE
nr:glycyl-radical enzyme activating protein [uncultured Schaedlerella sp.]